MKKEFLRFIIVGVINTGHYYMWYLLLIYIAQLHYMISHLIAVVISMIASYFLSIYFTYKVPFKWKSFLLFPLTQLFNVVMQSIGMFVVVEWLHLQEVVAPVFVLVITVPATYFVTRRILYGSKHSKAI